MLSKTERDDKDQQMATSLFSPQQLSTYYSCQTMTYHHISLSQSILSFNHVTQEVFLV